MEREPSQESPELSEARQKFVGLKNRFLSEVNNRDIRTHPVAEAILGEAHDVAVAALRQTNGDRQVIEALKQEFAQPILSQQSPESIHHSAFRIMIEDVEKEANKFSAQ